MDIYNLWISLTLTLALTLTLLLTPVTSLTEKVLLVSFDGFRWDYLDIVPGLTNFPKFAKEGTLAPYMNNTFTTLTFSTHYSMATGMYDGSVTITTIIIIYLVPIDGLHGHSQEDYNGC
jgi:predicted AlkP superfamily pyrophosphatase or phosphodiesterase